MMLTWFLFRDECLYAVHTVIPVQVIVKSQQIHGLFRNTIHKSHVLCKFPWKTNSQYLFFT